MEIEKILNLFIESNNETISGKYITEEINCGSTYLWDLVYMKILLCNPGKENMSINSLENEYALTKYYKRLVTLEKIKNGH